MKTKYIIILFLLLFLTVWLSNIALAEEPGEGYVPSFVSAGPSIISLPLEASPFTGEAFTSVPIWLPPSAGNMQEAIKLELQYRSGGNNSWAGKGWELELGYIAKINKFGANNPNNPYLLVLNGSSNELVNIGGNQYRTKTESNMRIEFNGSTWQAWDRGGTQYKFETSAGGKWVLTRVTDTHGISIVFEYDRVSNEEIYLREIRYPEGSGLSSYCKVSFISEGRADKIISYYYGSGFRVTRRLKEIQILAEGRIQKSYTLNYTTNGINQISLLGSVTEYGKDGSALPPIRFSYQQPLSNNIFEPPQEWLPDTGTAYTHQLGYNTDFGSVPVGIDMAIIDLNNDKLPDFIGCKYSSSLGLYKSEWVVRLGSGNGFSGREDKWLDLDNSVSSQTSNPGPITLTRNAALADMNKDGLPDLVYSRYGGRVNGSVPGYNTIVRYNTGNKFSDTETKLLDYNQSWHTVGNLTYTIRIGESGAIVDINGDGLPDLVYHRQRQWERWSVWDYGSLVINYLTFDLAARLNTGSGFSNEEKIWLTRDKTYFKYSYYRQLPCSGPPVSANYEVEFISLNKNAMFADMNNDGLVDLVYNDYSGRTVSQNFSGSLYCFTYSVPSYNWKVRYNMGDKFSDEENIYLNSAPAFIYKVYNEPPGEFVKGSSVRIGENGTLADINNDGLPDLVFNRYEGGSSYCNNKCEIKTPWWVCFNLGNIFAEPVKLLDSIDYSMKYNNYNQWRTNIVTYNSFFLDMTKDGVAELVYPQFIEWNSPFSGKSGNAKFKLLVCKNKGLLSADLLTRQTSAFGGNTDMLYEPATNFSPFVIPVVKSVTKNPGVGESGTTTYNYEDGWYDLANREFRGFRHVQTTDPLGYVSDTYFHQDNPRLGKIERQEDSITNTLNTYKTDDSAPYFTPLIQLDEWTDSKARRTAYEYDDYGNVLKTNYYGDIDVSGDEKSLLTDYVINSSLWLVNLPSRARIFSNTDGSGGLAAETQYYYDNNANYTDTPTKGDLTNFKNYLDVKNSYIQTTISYDAYGNAVTKTDANGFTTNIEYDSAYRSFPTKVTNPKGQVERNTYYLPSDSKGLFGQLRSRSDPNGNETSFEYDGFGRRTKVIGPYDVYSTYGSESYEYGINGPGANYVLTRATEDNGTSNQFIKVDILDGFERVIQSAKESEDVRIYSFVTTNYNGRGETARTSLPYFKDAGLRTSYLEPDGSEKWTQYTYDAIGRLTYATKPDGSTISNSYNGWTTNVVDENGRLKTFAKDAFGRLAQVIEKDAQDYSTVYNYDALDNLILATDNYGNKIQFSYDTLKRRIRMIDPDLGVWDYDYDNEGNLIQSTNANGKQINYSYDELNRLMSKDYADSPGTEIIYRYDETDITNGIGRRTSMQDLSGNSRWNYDQEGRAVKLEKTVGSDIYKIEWTYDAMDRVKSILLPNSRSINYDYNNAGLVRSIDGYVYSASYNASDQLTSLAFANPITTRFDYYPETLRLKSTLSSSLQDLNYEYDRVGNITKISDNIRAVVKNYSYDNLDRLLSGDGNTYEYNAIGNIVKANNIIQQYSPGKPHALVNDGSYAYTYDNCGNMLGGAGRSISYDPENRPLSITKNGVVTQFVYDGDGKRTKKTVAGGPLTNTTVYIDNLYEVEVQQTGDGSYSNLSPSTTLNDNAGLDRTSPAASRTTPSDISPNPVISPTNQNVSPSYSITDNLTPTNQIRVNGDNSTYTIDSAPSPTQLNGTLTKTASDSTGNTTFVSVTPQNTPIGLGVKIPLSDMLTGSFSSSVPLTVLPGRKGMQPNLSLTYRSSNPNSWLGLGFSLNPGYIVRSTRLGPPSYIDTQDTFYFISDAGTTELVNLIDNLYQAKVESNFTKFYKEPGDYWRVVAKDGSTLTFGVTVDSKEGSIQGTFAWYLTKAIDTNGNYISYTYTKDQGKSYLSRIDYTGKEAEGDDYTVAYPKNSIEFFLESRSDIPSSYISSAKITTAKRLKKIHTKVNGELVWRYELTYGETDTNCSLLDSITQYTSDKSSVSNYLHTPE